jgi:hypothetical protein
MAGRKRGDVPGALWRARARFAAWRRTRRTGTRIPKPLWTLAVELARDYGVHRTASALGLDYYALKKRVESLNGPGHRASTAFLELPPPSIPAEECILEFENGLGAQMRVHLKGHSPPDLAALGRSFWDAE